jgi:hypothetical protein
MDGFIHEFQIIFGFVQNKYYKERKYIKTQKIQWGKHSC